MRKSKPNSSQVMFTQHKISKVGSTIYMMFQITLVKVLFVLFVVIFNKPSHGCTNIAMLKKVHR